MSTSYFFLRNSNLYYASAVVFQYSPRPVSTRRPCTSFRGGARGNSFARQFTRIPVCYHNDEGGDFDPYISVG